LRQRTSGIDDQFESETGEAVSSYKRSRGLQPSDAVVGVGTISQLDLEVSYLEGAVTQEHLNRPGVLALDVTQAA